MFNKAQGPEAPCYGCTERSISCHSSCDKYKQYRECRKDWWLKRHHDRLDTRASVVRNTRLDKYSKHLYW